MTVNVSNLDISQPETLTVQHTGEFDCGCMACVGHIEDVNVGLVVDASVDDQAGTTAPNGKAIWTPDQIAQYLNRSGASWTGGPDPATQKGDTDPNTITFSFFNTQAELFDNGYVYALNGGLFGLSEYFNFASFNAAQRDATREAMGFWDDVVSVSFVEVDSAYDGDINFGNLASAPQTQAYARLPFGTLSSNATVNEQVQGIAGDVWVSASQASNFQLKPGGYGLNTLTHEIGHAIGLSHPGNYNFAPGFAVNYANGAEYYQDARNYTIMSYWNPRDIGARDFNFSVMALAYGGTPMIHDILAAQKMYGVDTTTRTGDTVYGFNSTAGKDVFDFTINKAPTVTIWDAGGNDTLDVSGYGTNQIINLNAGTLSSIGGVTAAEAALLTFEQVNANRAEMGYNPIARATYDANMAALMANPLLGRLTDNVGIAYGATIENAVGGSGNDLIFANEVANLIDGGAGNDTVSYDAATTGVYVSLNAGGGNGYAKGDRFTSVENLTGGDFNDTLVGDNNVNILNGGAGDDKLSGGGGDDILIGGAGADAFDGGAGIDTVDYSSAQTGVYASLNAGGARGDAQGDTFIRVENLIGTAFYDELVGDAANNRLEGRGGDDVLRGGAGDDVLIGGSGANFLSGGQGRDTFVFTLLKDEMDTIGDYQRGIDKIDLSAIDAIASTEANEALRYIGTGVFTGGKGGQVRFYEEDGSGYLAGDTDGDMIADFVIKLEGVTRILKDDLIL